jgi:hypothetical protein
VNPNVRTNTGLDPSPVINAPSNVNKSELPRSLAAQPSQAPACDTPYTIDTSGIRRYKLECL